MIKVSNNSGASAKISIDGDPVTNLESGFSISKTYSSSEFESLRFVKVIANGIYVSAISNVNLASKLPIEVTFKSNQGALKIVNKSGRTISNISISLSSTGTWGGNWLDGASLPTGSEIIFGVGVGLWDVRLIDESYIITALSNNLIIGTTTTKTNFTTNWASPLFSQAENIKAFSDLKSTKY